MTTTFRPRAQQYRSLPSLLCPEKPCAGFQHCSRWNATNSLRFKGSFSVSWSEMSNTSRIDVLTNQPRLKGDKTLAGYQQGGCGNRCETGSFVAHMVSRAWSWHTLVVILHNSHAGGRRSMKIVIFQYMFTLSCIKGRMTDQKSRLELN